MRAYESSFAGHRLTAAQLLLTHGDIDSRQRRTNAEHPAGTALPTRGWCPSSTNDSVAVEELRFGDNDRLGAEVASLCSAPFISS